MTSFATVANLETFIGLTISNTTRAQMFLDQATAFIQGYCTQDIAAEESEAIEMDGNGTDTLVLPERPVTAIASITVNGEAVASTGYEFNSAGVVKRIDGGIWGSDPLTYPNAIAVTYSHGQTVPDDVKAVCLAVAARALTYQAEDTGPQTMDGNPEAVGFAITLAGLTVSERKALTRYKRVLMA